MPRPPVGDERREQILDGLFHAMAEQGSTQASVTEIAAHCGLPRGALHYYFKNKDEMRRALMERMGRNYVAGMQAIVDKYGQQALRKLVRFHFRGDPGEHARLMAVWIDFWGQAPSDVELARIIADVQAGARATLVVAMQRLAPVLTQDQLHARAVCALALVEGVLLQWRVASVAGRGLDLDSAARAAEHQVMALFPGVA